MIDNRIIQLKNFSEIKNLIHGFSTRDFGSMKPNDPEAIHSLEQFSLTLQIESRNIVKMKQTHSDNIAWVSDDHVRARSIALLQFENVDGILTKEKNRFLSVLSADCMPVLFFDKKNKIAGAVHAGWRGIFNEILIEAVNNLIKRGSSPENILAGIGPCIRSCCYNIAKERAELFKNKYKGAKHHAPTNFLEKRNGQLFLDLPAIATKQLMTTGIPEKNIEDCNICTYDNKDLLYSYRREGKNFGEFIGIIGIK